MPSGGYRPGAGRPRKNIDDKKLEGKAAKKTVVSAPKGRMAKGYDGTNYATLENYSIYELSEIVRDRLLNKKMDYVRRTYIPKGNSGKKRPLGICSVWDKLVEKCIQLVLDPYCETKFVPSSFGFREQVSAHNALAKVKNQCQSWRNPSVCCTLTR